MFSDTDLELYKYIKEFLILKFYIHTNESFLKKKYQYLCSRS
jgi:hypothetical protein